MSQVVRACFLYAFLSLTAGSSSLAQAQLCKSPIVVTVATEQGRTSPVWFQLGGSPQQYKPLVVDGDALISSAPWAVDGNHSGGTRTYGVGNLHLIALAWFPRYPKEPDGDWLSVHCVDLHQATLTVDLTHDLALPGKGVQPFLAFWFQSSSPNGSRVVNYAYREPLLNSKMPQTIMLSPRLNAWQCLGTNDVEEAGRRLYGCAASQEEFDTMLSSVSIDMGIVALLGTGSKNAIGATGTVRIRRIEVRPGK